MRVGTKSVLFGAHQFALHPIVLALAWTRLYGLIGQGARTRARDGETPEQWVREVKRYVSAWIAEHRDGRADAWTGTDSGRLE